MTTPAIFAAAEPVIEEIGVQIDVLDQEGRGYAERLLDHHLHTNGGPCPHRPTKMHPLVAKAIREMVFDQAVSLRLHGARRRKAAA